MESKYSLFTKNSQNLKRKFSYGSSNSAPPPKINHLQNVPKLSKPSTKSNITQSGNSNTMHDIQSQRQQLPVYAVRQQ